MSAADCTSCQGRVIGSCRNGKICCKGGTAVESDQSSVLSCLSGEGTAEDGNLVNNCTAFVWESPGGSDSISTTPGSFGVIHRTRQTTCQLFVLLENFYIAGPDPRHQCKDARLTIDGQDPWQRLPAICGENSDQFCESGYGRLVRGQL